jgi:predicted secreted protein
LNEIKEIDVDELERIMKIELILANLLEEICDKIPDASAYTAVSAIGALFSKSCAAYFNSVDGDDENNLKDVFQRLLKETITLHRKMHKPKKGN